MKTRSPTLPMASVLQEAHDLLRVCREPETEERLVLVGLPAGFARDLEARIDAAREAQSDWARVRDGRQPFSLVDLRAKAAALRSDLLAAGRFSLRDGQAEGALSRIRGGRGDADLIQDLFDLGAVLERNADAFTQDRSFDVCARSAEARSLAEALSARVSDGRLDRQPGSPLDLRNRAFSHLDDLVREIRRAARYAFRREPEALKAFGSRYRRLHRVKGGAAGQ